MIKLLNIFVLNALFIFFLSACKSKKEDDFMSVVPSSQLYQSGITLLEKNQYEQAADTFAKIFQQNPSDPLVPRAELMQAYSLFLESKYDESIDVINSFIKLYAGNEDIAYAYYLKGLCFYMEISSLELDQSKTFMAKDAFEDVINLFPGSKYALDASLKMDLIYDNIAGKNMDVGRYYLKQNNPLAATGRFEEVIHKYKTTSHVPEALYRLVECYLMLNLRKESQKYAAILKYNYPESKWFKYACRLLQNTQSTATKTLKPKTVKSATKSVQ